MIQKFINRIKPVIFILFLVGVLGMVACNDDHFSTNPNDKLSFSKDTLTFDTVFTTIGTATSKILVYNKNKSSLKISEIRLAGGSSSMFRINVDGSAGTRFDEIEIRAKDSMYIFVDVKIDPNNVNSPVLVEDSIVFLTNGTQQRVRLEAFGQDMILLKNKTILNDTTLTERKPYLIYGHLTVDTAKTLTLEPGTRLYFHNNANLVVYGNLQANGTREKPILLRGDRLDNIRFVDPVPYNYVSGQWGGVFLLWNEGRHVLNFVNMSSGYVGLYFSNDDRSKLPELSISNCRIHNFLLYGLVAKNGNLTVTNTEISNTSSYSVFLNGGKHRFIHTTIANYFNSGFQPVSRDGKPAVMIMDLNRIAPMETEFKNCVICGTNDNEFSLATKFPSLYRGTFDHCYIRKAKADTQLQFSNIRWYERKDSVFKCVVPDLAKKLYYNYVPDSISPIRGLADPEIISKYGLEYDLNGNLRDDKPDAGAYEWIPGKRN